MPLKILCLQRTDYRPHLPRSFRRAE